MEAGAGAPGAPGGAAGAGGPGPGGGGARGGGKDPAQLLARLRELVERLGGALEEGWTVQLVRRGNGNSAGHEDAYYFSPGRKRFRSRSEVARFLGFEVQAPARKAPSTKQARVRGPGACGRPRLVWHHVKGWPCWPAEELPAKLWRGGAATLDQAGLELPAACLEQKRKPEAVLLQYFGSGDFGWAPPEALKEYEAGLAAGLAEKSNAELFRGAVDQAKGRHDGTLPFAKENPSLPKWWDTPPPWSPPPSLEEEENAGPPPWKQGLAGSDAEPYRQRRAWPSDLWDLPPETFKIPAEIQVMQAPKFRGLRKNVWHGSLQRPKRLPNSEIEVCSCTQDNPCGENSNCLNRNLSVRCSGLCPCGDKCQNREFSQVKTPKLKRFLTKNGCGWAVRAGEAIKRGKFVVEYCGEVVDDVECERRMWEARRVGEPNFYMMQISSNLVIDAREMGCIARLINSSCDPNCRAEVWTDAATGEQRVGIFALRDIPEGEEVTYDYHFQHFDIHNKTSASFQCRCGAANCRGTLDSNPERVRDFGREIEVQWSDEKFYIGTVKSFDVGSSQHTIVYAGGQVEKVNLRIAKHKWLTGGHEGQPPITKDGEALALKKRGKKRGRKRAAGRSKKIAKPIEKVDEEKVACDDSAAVKVESDKENSVPRAKPEPLASAPAPSLATAA